MHGVIWRNGKEGEWWRQYPLYAIGAVVNEVSQGRVVVGTWEARNYHMGNSALGVVERISLAV